MRNIYALLLVVLGLVVIIFNRFAVEESMRIIPNFVFPRLPVWLGRVVAILGGLFFVLFGVLMMMGYLQTRPG